MEHILKPGDTCLDCQRHRLTRKLRYFYINLEEKVLKCESDECLYPLIADEDIDDDAKNYEELTELKPLAEDGLKIIEELFLDTKPTEPFLPGVVEPTLFDLTSNVEQFKDKVSASACNKINIFSTHKAEKPDAKQKIENASSSSSLVDYSSSTAFISNVSAKDTEKTNDSSTDLPSTSAKGIPKAQIRRTVPNNTKEEITKKTINIPKAEVTPRLYTAKAKASKPTPSLANHVIVRCKNKPLNKKKPGAELEITQKGTMRRPLDLLEEFLKNKVNP